MVSWIHPPVFYVSFGIFNAKLKVCFYFYVDLYELIKKVKNKSMLNHKKNKCQFTILYKILEIQS